MHITRPVENFFRKLRFKHKIAVMFIAVIVPFLIPSYFTYESFYKDLKIAKNELKALKIVNHISMLVKELQEHRSIMQGVLNKNENFKKEAVKKEKEISAQFSYLERFKNIIDSAKFKNEWLKIKSTKDPIKNFLLHTKLIEELLLLNKNIAAHYNLYREKNVNSYAAILSIFDILPSIQENIDKIRGSLTEILSKHTIKEKIQNLLIELKSKSDMLKYSLQVYLQTKNNHKLINKSKSIEAELKNYINSIENIINQENQISAQNFFDFSTKTISKITSFHKELLDDFRIQLEKREKTAYLKILLLSLGLLSVALTSFYLFLGFYYSIKKPLDKILKATQRLANKDYSKNLTINTEDEFKEIADTFNKMQKEIKDHISFLKWYQIALDSATLVTKGDIKGDITYANKAFLDAVGYSLDEILGKPHSILRDPRTPKKVYENLWKIILNKRVWKGILKIRAKNGRELVMKTSIVPILDEKENIKEFVAVRVDITDLIQAQKRIEKMLYFDNLTSLPNRTKLIEDTRKNKIYAVTIFNIDDFRQINDIYGFEAGNQILKNMAKILKTFEKRDCKLYRLPSDEFAFVLFSKKDKEELKK